ncbi:transcriptional regulator [uncultured Algimonas sp.]|uniref:winged helix-turn-helix domain-containing protein n=1 Tax=uncultured Algimonas sp. TaxID=1547920 RepID=UPI002609C04C|nr:transcriptional regulator [uncultured Algimonas sp.]
MTETPDFDLGAIDDVIHGRLRLGVMAYLSAVSPASFPELRDRTDATNGNLSTHLTKLEGAGYVRLEKGYKGKRPQTLVHLTKNGRAAWIDYLDAMKQLLGG